MNKLLLLLSVSAGLLLYAPVSGSAHILDLHQGEHVPLEAVVEDLQKKSLVFVGELHGREGHHRAQLQIIQALHEAGKPIAVGVEMMRQEDQAILDRWVAGEISEEEFIPIFNRSWSMWPSYRPIFLYAREQKIPMIGLNISREVTRQVARQGFGSLTEQQLGELPEGIRCDVDERYMAFIRRALGQHGHDEITFRNFCEAQMLWDSVMAQNLLDYLEKNPERTVVTLAGNAHAWKYGIPEQVNRQRPVPFRVLLPEIPGRMEPGLASVDDADYLMLGVEEGPLH